MIDTHVHLLPGRLGARVREFFVEWWRRRLRLPDRPRQVVEEMLLVEGITGVWNLPYVHKPGMAEALNVASATIAAGAAIDSGLDVVAGCSVHPRDDDAVAVVRRASRTTAAAC